MRRYKHPLTREQVESTMRVLFPVEHVILHGSEVAPTIRTCGLDAGRLSAWPSQRGV
jgi:hypothetical protein